MHSFIQSDLFTFYIGPEKRPFVVHSRAITATSPVFDKLVNGGLKESQDRCAEFKDVDPATFIRFLEYAYRRDYTIPSWAPDANVAEKNVPTSDDVLDEDWREAVLAHPKNSWSNSKSAPSDYGAIASTKNYTKPSADQNPRAAFSKREYRHPAHDVDDPDSLHPQVDPIANASPSQNFTPVFLAHARLYTFADVHMARRLKDLILNKLHKTLVTFRLYPERLGDVAELVRYAYEQGEDRTEDGKIDALRDLVVSFVVSEMKILGGHVDFRDLMEAGGEFAGDFWRIVSQ